MATHKQFLELYNVLLLARVNTPKNCWKMAEALLDVRATVTVTPRVKTA